MKRSELSPYAREVLSICEVHLRADELGLIAACLLKEVRLSSTLRGFKDALSVEQQGDIADYLLRGSLPGGYWIWQEPLRLDATDVPPPVPAKRPRKGRKQKGGTKDAD